MLSSCVNSAQRRDLFLVAQRRLKHQDLLGVPTAGKALHARKKWSTQMSPDLQTIMKTESVRSGDSLESK
jgi:hypothetical protein